MRKVIEASKSKGKSNYEKSCIRADKLLKELSTLGNRKIALLKADSEMGDDGESKIENIDRLSELLDEAIVLLRDHI